MSPAQEQAVIQRLKAGAGAREEAFNQVFEATREQVFAICRHLTQTRAEAEDALQDCFLSVHQGLPNFRGDARLSTWIYRIAIHASFKVRARRHRNPAPLEAAAHEPDDRAQPDDLAASRQEASRVQLALQQLSPEHQLVLTLFAVDGLGHAEIADVLGVPLGTVWSRLHLARKRLGELCQLR